MQSSHIYVLNPNIDTGCWIQTFKQCTGSTHSFRVLDQNKKKLYMQTHKSSQNHTDESANGIAIGL